LYEQHRGFRRILFKGHDFCPLNFGFPFIAKGGSMQVQLNTDNHIENNAKLTEYVEALIQDTLERFNRRITSVHVHLTDENSGHKSGSDDKRCVMEARVSGRQPITVTANAPTVNQALDGGIVKLEKSLGSIFDRLDHAKGRPSMAGEGLPAGEESL
jgi:ribosome-associated translation inhibitor RaiA